MIGLIEGMVLSQNCCTNIRHNPECLRSLCIAKDPNQSGWAIRHPNPIFAERSDRPPADPGGTSARSVRHFYRTERAYRPCDTARSTWARSLNVGYSDPFRVFGEISGIRVFLYRHLISAPPQLANQQGESPSPPLSEPLSVYDNQRGVKMGLLLQRRFNIPP